MALSQLPSRSGARFTGPRQGWCRRGSAPALFVQGRFEAQARACRGSEREKNRQGVGRSYNTVSFLSDFGKIDEFVGVVNSVIRGLARHVTVVDLTHDVPPYDVRSGALALAAPPIPAERRGPRGGRPGGRHRAAGHRRRGGGARGCSSAPTTGCWPRRSPWSAGPSAPSSSPTPRYHLEPPGPDLRRPGVFGPVPPTSASASTSPRWESRSTPTLIPRSCRCPGEEGGELAGEVLWVDRFGNAQLNVGPTTWTAGATDPVRFGDTVRTAALVVSYGPVGRRPDRAGGRLLRASGRVPRPGVRPPTSSTSAQATRCAWPGWASPTGRRRYAGVVPAPFLGRTADVLGPCGEWPDSQRRLAPPGGWLGIGLAD